MQEYDYNQTHIIDIPLEKAMTTDNLQVFYGDNHAMHDATLAFPRHPELNWPTKINLRKKIFIMTDVTQRYHVTLPSSKVIQKFYLDFPNKMAYFLQMAAGSATDMTLTYGGFDPSNSEINLSNNPTQMHLTNFGHGQTFELFNWNNQLYAWVMTYAGSNVNKDGDHWATRVARLPIDGNSKTPADVNSITFLNYMGTRQLSSYQHLEAPTS